MSEVGRPSQYTDEVKLKIKELFLQSKTLEEIANTIEIPIGTIDYWRAVNYQGFKDFLYGLKLERMFNKSVDKLEDIIDIPAITEEGKNDKDMLKLQQDTAKHITETLGKDKGFSKRVENTGKDGKDLMLNINYAIAEKNGISQSTTTNSIGQS